MINIDTKEHARLVRSLTREFSTIVLRKVDPRFAYRDESLSVSKRDLDPLVEIIFLTQVRSIFVHSTLDTDNRPSVIGFRSHLRPISSWIEIKIRNRNVRAMTI